VSGLLALFYMVDRHSLPTWVLENATVGVVLLGVWIATDCELIELGGAAAVFCGFCHASIAERMREREAVRAAPSVECHRMLSRFFVVKEVLWLGYFAARGAWSAIVGCVLFALYPLWRKVWRRWWPIEAGS
jgi:hypothetical protein